jgi:hypothetical protein
MIKQPRASTVKRIVEHLESIGLGVYGPHIDLSDGELTGANMDFDADQVLRYRTLYNSKKIYDGRDHS